MKKYIIILTLLSLTRFALATTWFDGEATDPISGEIVKVQSIGSYGGYIYRWPSKYDAIFWPYTDSNHIRFNSSSGYIAFGGDFEDITDDEKKKVSDFLEQNYDPENPPQTHIEKLKWLEKVYQARGADDKFFIRHHCLLSYLTREDKEISNQHREKALSLIRPYLQSAAPSPYRTHLYIVAGFYSKLLETGEEAKFWDVVVEQDLGVEDAEEEKGTREYMLTVLEELKSGDYKENYYR